MKSTTFWTLLVALMIAASILYCLGAEPASAETLAAADPKPIVKVGPPSTVLIRIGQPYIVFLQAAWPSRWDIRKPRH